MDTTIYTPVLLIGFNRPDTIKVSFDYIRKTKPQKLYVAIDGPRNNKPGEQELSNQVLRITRQIDWNCDAKYLIREKNIGCKLNVTGAISWVLEKEDRVIIIEDDVVAEPAFFSFAEELLEKYKDDERIAMISSNQYTPIEMEADYLFTKYGHIWGWATWKRVWKKFDVNVPEIEAVVSSGFKDISFINNIEYPYFKKYFGFWMEKIKNKTDNAWGPQFFFFRLRNNLLSIAPKVNLASNIGVSSSRTDSVSKRNENYYSAERSFVLTNHTKKVEINNEYDIHHFKKLINRKPSMVIRLFWKALSILNYK
ncbi:MAG TPA: hypothetical protein VLH61_07275 [Bacteroidales bacterium]|nr:hypothetical protein [Bacteroidales bacterium]